MGTRPVGDAFSLIELLIVMGIIVVLISLSLPAVNSVLRGQELRAAISDFEGVTAFARHEALAKNTYIWLSISPAQCQQRPALLLRALGSQNRIADPSAANLKPMMRDKILRGVEWLATPPDKTGGMNRPIASYLSPPSAGGNVTLRFSPSGEVVIDGQSLAGFYEIGIKGANAPAGNSAVLQVSGLNGANRVYRP